jgi:putative transposase
MCDLVRAETAGSGISVASACRALSLSRATFYRKKDINPVASDASRAPRLCQHDLSRLCRVPGRTLAAPERARVLAELHSDRFMDLAAPQVWATLLDEGVYLCSLSTMYRLLRMQGEVMERRKVRSATPAKRPELLATGPNEVWSWDITKLKGPRKWSYFYLYVIIDVFSRCVVGWCIAEHERAQIAEAMIQDALLRQNIPAGTLTLHADRGSAMTSTTVSELLIDLGVTRSHSRPHTSNDNPFSESHFKTMKYRPEVPDRFESADQARVLFRTLFCWYNEEHRHSALALLSPATVHAGKGEEAIRARAKVLDAAYAAHPERFVKRPPRPDALPDSVWINPPVLADPSRDGSASRAAEEG